MFLFVFVFYHVTVWMGSNKLNWTELNCSIDSYSSQVWNVRCSILRSRIQFFTSRAPRAWFPGPRCGSRRACQPLSQYTTKAYRRLRSKPFYLNAEYCIHKLAENTDILAGFRRLWWGGRRRLRRLAAATGDGQAAATTRTTATSSRRPSSTHVSGRRTSRVTRPLSSTWWCTCTTTRPDDWYVDPAGLYTTPTCWADELDH